MRDESLYVPLHAGIWTHPKTARVVRALRLKAPSVVGHLVALWHHALAHAPGGRLDGYNAVDVADAAMWTRPAQAFVDALVSAGWLHADDGGYVVHGWEDYAGEGLKLRAAERERSKARREAARRDREATGARPVATENDRLRPETTTVDLGRSPVDHPATGTGTGTGTGTEEHTQSARAEEASESLQQPSARPTGRSENENNPTTVDQRSTGGRPAVALHAEPVGKPSGGDAARAPMRPMHRGRGVVGLEERERWDPSPAAFLARMGDRWSARWPGFDGCGGRPAMAEKVTAMWASYEAHRERNGIVSADAAITSWLARDYSQGIKRSYEQDGGLDIEAIAGPSRGASP